jgi:hypothetical protein
MKISYQPHNWRGSVDTITTNTQKEKEPMTFKLQDIGTWDGQCLEELEKEGTLMYIKDRVSVWPKP